jgi:nitrite reductase (cytochrome c-552)
MGFHAPQESARILGESIDYSRQAQVEAQKLVLEKNLQPGVTPQTTIEGITPDAKPSGP